MYDECDEYEEDEECNDNLEYIQVKFIDGHCEWHTVNDLDDYKLGEIVFIRTIDKFNIAIIVDELCTEPNNVSGHYDVYTVASHTKKLKSNELYAISVYFINDNGSRSKKNYNYFTTIKGLKKDTPLSVIVGMKKAICYFDGYLTCKNESIKLITKEIIGKLEHNLNIDDEFSDNKKDEEVAKNKNIENKENEVKMESKSMFKGMFNGMFGKLTDGEVAMTFNGQIAVKRNEGEYVRYNSETDQIENQMDFVFKDANDFMFMMPAQVLNIGDVIKSKQTFYQVTEILPNGSIKGVNIKTGVKSHIIKEATFGFGFWNKVVCLLNGITNQTQTGINPMMLMFFAGRGEEKGFNDMLKNMMMLRAFSGGNMFGSQQVQSPFANLFGNIKQSVKEPVKENKSVNDIVKEAEEEGTDGKLDLIINSLSKLTTEMSQLDIRLTSVEEKNNKVVGKKGKANLDELGK